MRLLQRPLISLAVPGLLLPLVLIAQTGCLAYSFQDAESGGTAIRGLTSSSVSLCGLRSVYLIEPGTVLTNPANIPREPGLQVSGSLGPTIWVESADNPYRIQRSGLTFSPVSLYASLQPFEGVGFAAGVARITDLSYFAQETDYEEAGVDTVTIVISEAECTGGIWECSAGASFEPLGGLCIGVSAGMRFGSGTSSISIDSLHTSVLDSSLSESRSWKEPAFHAGFVLADSLMGCGMAFSSGSDGVVPVLSGGAYTMLSYLNNGTFGFEAEVSDPAGVQDVVVKLFADVPMGEHALSRWGVSFNDGEASSRAGIGFSLGMAIDLGRFGIEGGYYYWTRSRNGGPFPYQDDPVTMDDSANTLALGISYSSS
ncbi:hypothetical protein JW921_07030 [Candidatus Fermentibacterales bacterium]|nr:hypothetical protein [Candidatus Fermentibacterales bacterium]